MSFRKFLAIVAIVLVPAFAFAQAKHKPVKKSSTAKVKAQAPTEVPAAASQKKNESPAETVAIIEPVKTNKRDGGVSAKDAVRKDPPVYFYEFDRPGFTYPNVKIEHDESGKGTIAFTKSGFTETLTDPLQLSPVTLENIKKSLTALNFLDSTENYQYQKDFSNMGNVIFSVRKQGRERTVKYNWTTNKDAKALMDEYRRISNQHLWKFEINIARENQPLECPSLMDTLDSYLRQSEISDPPSLLPFLTEISNDERMPLIARNHATKLIKSIEKAKK